MVSRQSLSSVDTIKASMLTSNHPALLKLLRLMMPRSMRTLPTCLTFDRDSPVFRSFEQNSVQVVWGDPFQKVGGGGTVGVGSAGF
jgi:hypothetical protein